jgi:hypothetical protein
VLDDLVTNGLYKEVSVFVYELFILYIII